MKTTPIAIFVLSLATTLACHAVPVTGWELLFDGESNATLTDRSTDEPDVTQAKKTSIAANFPSIVLSDGDFITLSGTVTFDKALVGGQFRVGLFNGATVADGVANPYVGLYTIAPAGSTGDLIYGPGTSTNNLFAGGQPLDTDFTTPATALGADNPIDFVLSITRNGNNLDITTSYIVGDGSSYSGSGSVDNLDIATATGASYDFTYNTAGFLHGSTFASDMTATFSNINVTSGSNRVKITAFTYDPATGNSEASITGNPDTNYLFTRAPDMDFTASIPVPLDGVTVGTKVGNDVTTDGSGNATVQINLGTGPRDFMRAETAPPPPPLFEDDMENGVGDWTMVSNDVTKTNWQLSMPGSGVGPVNGVGPATGAGGSAYCFGTNITADYGPNADVWLRSKAIDIPAGGATLTYQRFIDTDGVADLGSVNIVDADGAFLAEVQTGITGIATGWEESIVTLPTAANGQTIKLEFRFVSDDANGEFAGFYIDDVVVATP